MHARSRIGFHPLTHHRREQDIIVAYEKGGAYLTVEDEGLRIINHLKRHSIGETEKAFPDKDVRGFIDLLLSKGFVHTIDHRVMSGPRRVKTLIDIPAKSLGWTKGYLFDGAALGLILAGLILLLSDPGLLPHPQDLFSIGWLSMMIPAVFLTYWAVTFIHEIGHYVLLRRTGHETNISLVHRWHMILPRTDLKAVRMLEPHDKLLVHMGGLLAEAVLASVAIVFLTFGIAQGFWSFVLLIIIIDILLQLSPIPGSDLTEAAEQHHDAERLPKRTVRSLVTGKLCCDEGHDKERSFFPLWMIGSLLLAIALLVYVIPNIAVYIATAVDGLLAGAVLGLSIVFADSLIALVLVTVFMALYAVSVIKEHHLSARRGFTWSVVGLFLLSNYLTVFLIYTAFVLNAPPQIVSVALMFLGLSFGALFLKLLEHIRVHEAGVARDLLLPVAAAATAILLLVMSTWFSVATGQPQAGSIHAIAYAVGMLAAIIV